MRKKSAKLNQLLLLFKRFWWAGVLAKSKKKLDKLAFESKFKYFGELAFKSKTKNSLFGALQQVWKGLKGINETFCHSFGAYRGAAEDWGVIRFLFPSVFGQEGGQ